jgi:hypothetical protein
MEGRRICFFLDCQSFSLFIRMHRSIFIFLSCDLSYNLREAALRSATKILSKDLAAKRWGGRQE